MLLWACTHAPYLYSIVAFIRHYTWYHRTDCSGSSVVVVFLVVLRVQGVLIQLWSRCVAILATESDLMLFSRLGHITY